MLFISFYRDCSVTPPLLEVFLNKNFQQASFLYKKLGLERDSSVTLRDSSVTVA